MHTHSHTRTHMCAMYYSTNLWRIPIRPLCRITVFGEAIDRQTNQHAKK